MPLKIVSGEVQSQDINDNNSYLENQINQVNAGPLGVLNNASELTSKYPNGANGYFVVLESDGKTGYMYTWDGTKWVKGALYQSQGIAEQSIGTKELKPESVKPSITTFATNSDFNIFDGEFTRGYILIDLKILNLSEDSAYRFAIVKVSENETYTVMRKRNVSERNGMYFSSDKPKDQLQLQGSEVTMTAHPDGKHEYYTFTVPSGMNYAYHYLGNVETEIQITKGEMPQEFTQQASKLKGLVEVENEILANNITTGKNLFNQKWLNGWIGGGVGTKTGALTIKRDTTAKFAIVPIKPNTMYSVSKTASDRFRLSLTNERPKEQVKIWDVLTDERHDSKTQMTFNSGDNKYLGMFFADSSAPPSFVQLEESDHVTEWESYGYQFYPQAKSLTINTNSSEILPNTPEYYGAKGFKVFDENRKAWQDEGKTIPADDDTKALQNLFSNAKGCIYFSSDKKYLVSDTLQFDPQKIKYINGQGSTVYGKGDIPIIVAKGSTTGNGGSIGAATQVRTELFPIVENLSITNVKKFDGIGFRVNQCLGLILKSCSIYQCRINYQIYGNNRNLFVDSCHIFNGIYNVHTADNANIHQLLISNSMVLFGKINYFFENSSMFNVTISNGDIETDNDFAGMVHAPTECNIKILAMTSFSVYEDVKFTSSTVECHKATKKLVHVEASDPSKIVGLMLNDLEFGNSNGNDVYLKNVTGTSVVGCISKYGTGASVMLDGTINGLNLSGLTEHGGTGGILKCADDTVISSLNVTGVTTTSQITNGIDLSNAKELKDSVIVGNVVRGVKLPANKNNVIEVNNV